MHVLAVVRERLKVEQVKMLCGGWVGWLAGAHWVKVGVHWWTDLVGNILW